MTSNPLDAAVERYKKAISELESVESIEKITAENVLDALFARDAVHSALCDRTQATSSALIRTIRELDDRLRKQFKAINKVIKITDWQAVVDPPRKSWWWNPPSWLDRFDWLWELLSYVFLAGSTAAVIYLFALFFTGSKVGLLGIIISSLSALIAGGSLTRQGREMIMRMLDSAGLPRKLQDEFTFLISLAVLLFLMVLYFLLPQIAGIYESRGNQYYQLSQLGDAETNYMLANKLANERDQSNPDVHYKLGRVYDSWAEKRVFNKKIELINQAISEYEKAVDEDTRDGKLEENSYRAYARVSRLYISQGATSLEKSETASENYSKAVDWSLNGTTRLKRSICTGSEKPEVLCKALDEKNLTSIESETLSAEINQLNNEKKNALEYIYALYVNRSLAHFQLTELSKAQTTLDYAIRLLPNKARAYCLLAQVLEAQKADIQQQSEAKDTKTQKTTQLKLAMDEKVLSNWEQCVAYARQISVTDDADQAESGKSPLDPYEAQILADEAQWYALGRDRLKQFYGG